MDAIVRETEATKIHAIGHILVLYKPSDDRKIELPKR
jgi:RNA-binding protein